jgi:aspartyl-tRNA(Asn)/glutamyl-tRNA(Gln) amidotransferase subunit A
VERLKKAGAIALGKTGAGVRIHSDHEDLLFGVSRNPWNPERTPGGSSGGSSAAVASGQVPFCTGSDGGGSIRIPCSWTGLPGLKCSFGRIPMGPHDMLDWGDTSVFGAMARTVKDIALYTDQVVGTSEPDPNALPHPGYSYVDVLDRLPKVAHRLEPGPRANIEPYVRRECLNGVKAFEMGHRRWTRWGTCSTASVAGGDIGWAPATIYEAGGAWDKFGTPPRRTMTAKRSRGTGSARRSGRGRPW